MDVWEWVVAAILGLVEGLTEYAPVSSTGHMIIVDDLWLKSSELVGSQNAYVFKIVIQLGSILAVALLFKDRLLQLAGFKKQATTQSEGRGLTLGKVAVGLVPAAVLGLLFEDKMESIFHVRTVAFALIAGAFLMIAADFINKRNNKKKQQVDDISYKQALAIGLFQCLALWPGFSRSGSTISGGVMLGLTHRAAANFTFIMAIPIMVGASALSLIKNWDALEISLLPFYATGFISAFLVSLVVVRFFLKLINKIKLVPFALYRIALGLLLLFLFS
ncbi:UDP pyrophosphate phosphatase [Niallia circulans]|nr:UDP pyrophosphate phosphatase [Niallia circulans]